MIWSRLILAAIAIALLFLANLPAGEFYVGSQSDKVNHIAAFLVISVLAVLAFPKLSLLSILLGLAIFNALIETSQGLMALGREPDILDWVAGFGATVLVLALFQLKRIFRDDRI